MTKQDTSILKGIAILFMVWLHCFNERIGHVFDYLDVIVGGGNLSFILTRLTGPVELYILLSGYGLYYTYTHKASIGWVGRLSKLYGLYVFTLLIFVPLVCILGNEQYSLELTDIISNVTGWNTTYNVTIWFLFPYAVTVMLASCLFHWLDKKAFLMIFASCGLYIGAYLISWLSHHSYITPMYAINELVRVLNMEFPFIIGAAMCKFDLVSKVKAYSNNKQMYLVGALIGLCVIRLSTDFDFMLQLVYSLMLIVIVSAIRKPEWLIRTLSFFGKHSTTMWLVHAYFIWYLFAEFPYTLKYPILIFGVSLIQTTIAAVLIDWCYPKIQNTITKMYAKTD